MQVTALGEQSVTVPGTVAFGRIITGVASQLRQVGLERKELAEDLEARLEAHPLAGAVDIYRSSRGARSARSSR